MSSYSIKDLENLSGIKAHTLRIWEQRYSFIHPKRTETNIRYYDDKDLRLILNISLLNKNGIKISKIASMGEGEIEKQVLKLTEKDVNYHDQIQSLTISMVELDEERFEKTISTCILQFGLEQAMVNIIYPFLYRVGILWQTNTVTPAHEHFITNLIRQKLIVAIDGQFQKEKTRNAKFMLFLPEGEYHEISLLFGCYLIKSRGYKVVYMGQSLPLSDLKEAFKLHSPDYLLTIITSTPGPEDVQEYLKKLSQKFKATPIILSGFQVIENTHTLPPNIQVLKTCEEFIAFLDQQTV